MLAIGYNCCPGSMLQVSLSALKRVRLLRDANTLHVHKNQKDKKVEEIPIIFFHARLLWGL